MDKSKLQDAWPVDAPPADFAQRTVAMAGVRAEKRRQRRIATTVATLAVAAAALLVVTWPMLRGPKPGSASAEQRMEVRVADRAKAVLEAGARIAWRGDVVEQPTGDVFYRVEPGEKFSVNTPAGTIEVLGTCFRVQVGNSPRAGDKKMKKQLLAASAGAAIAAIAVVTVYEGKVQLLGAKERVTLGAGESGSIGPEGAKKLEADELSSAEAALEEAGGDKDKLDLSRANDALAGDIANLNRKLRGLEKEKGKLEEQLVSAQTELARRTDGKPPRDRNEFDLDQNDWVELAKTGTIKYRVPCLKQEGWTPGPKHLDKLGLAPGDAETIRASYQRSHERIWPQMRELCIAAIGKAEVADVLGADTCTHVVVDMARRTDSKGASEAMRQVAEVRAGTRAEADPAVAKHPVFKLFTALTGEMKDFEKDLAESFGPEEAARLAYAKGMCHGSSTFGGPGPRKP